MRVTLVLLECYTRDSASVLFFIIPKCKSLFYIRHDEWSIVMTSYSPWYVNRRNNSNLYLLKTLVKESWNSWSKTGWMPGFYCLRSIILTYLSHSGFDWAAARSFCLWSAVLIVERAVMQSLKIRSVPDCIAKGRAADWTFDRANYLIVIITLDTAAHGHERFERYIERNELPCFIPI